MNPEKNGADSGQLEEIMRKYDRESNVRIWQGGYGRVVSGLLMLFSLYCIYMTLFSTALPETRLSLFLGFIVIAGYLVFPASKKHVKPDCLPWYDIVLMAAGAFCFFYFAANAMEIITLSTRIEPMHVVLGTVGLLVMMELCRRSVGLPILCIVGLLLGYAFFNQLSYNGNVYSALRTIIYKLFYTTNGVIGTPTNVCFTYIVLFIIFGAFLERTGISAFFIAFANRLAGSTCGGPAKVAVLSSALCGMVSGSSVGNTVTTGSVTIPMMKKTGYKPEFAGAVEAAASTGGQIMPPIMGAAAFLMAEYMNLPYTQVALKAILPAVLYFAGIFIAVHLEAKKQGLRGIAKEDLPKWGYLLKNCYLLIPLVLLVYLVSSGAKTMASSAAISICCAFAVGVINRLLTPSGESVGEKMKASAVSAAEALSAGAKGSVTVAVACAMAGMIAGCITVTGLASVLINGIVNMAGNATVIGLVLTMLCCIVLGMGVPTTANYCIMASTCAPILIRMGFPVVAAHFFVFYFGIVADITPPVALAAFAGSAIAKANPMKTGFCATRLAVAAFIVPYIFAYSPQMLLENITAWYQVVIISVTAILGLYAVAAGLSGYLLRRTDPISRIMLFGGGLCMMVPEMATDFAGMFLFSVVLAWQMVQNRRKA